MYHIFIHSSVDGHLGYFHVLTILNSAAMNIGRRGTYNSLDYRFLQIYVQEWDCWIIGQLFFNFLRSFHTVLLSICTN